MRKKIFTTYPFLGQEEKDILYKVVDSGWYSQGEEVFKFEEEFAKKVDRPYAIAASSGSAANLLILDALLKMKKIKKGDKVLTPALTYITTVAPIIQLGLIPEFGDIVFDYKSPHYLTLDPKVKSSSKLLFPVNFLGFKSQEYSDDILRIEDSCNRIRFTGNDSYAESWSFFPAHHYCTGEGSMITTTNSTLASIVKSLKEYGRTCYLVCNYPRCPQVLNPKYMCPNVANRLKFSFLGWNLKMTNFQGALGRVQLSKSNIIQERRHNNAKYMIKKLSKFRTYGIIMPEYNEEVDWFAFPIVLDKDINRTSLEKFLNDRNIETRQLLGGNILDQEAMKEQKYKVSGNLENTKYVSDHGFMIGIHPSITKEDIDFIATSFQEYFERGFK